MATARLLVDTSALLCRYLVDRRRSSIDRLVAGADQIVVTALARTEVELGLHAALGVPRLPGRSDPFRRFIEDWDHFWVIPLDQQSLRRASDLGRIYGLNLTNSLHLAALDRVPRPATLLTVDDRQLAAATDLGFEIADIDGDDRSAHGLLASG